MGLEELKKLLKFDFSILLPIIPSFHHSINEEKARILEISFIFNML